MRKESHLTGVTRTQTRNNTVNRLPIWEEACFLYTLFIPACTLQLWIRSSWSLIQTYQALACTSPSAVETQKGTLLGCWGHRPRTDEVSEGPRGHVTSMKCKEDGERYWQTWSSGQSHIPQHNLRTAHKSLMGTEGSGSALRPEGILHSAEENQQDKDEAVKTVLQNVYFLVDVWPAERQNLSVIVCFHIHSHREKMTDWNTTCRRGRWIVRQTEDTERDEHGKSDSQKEKSMFRDKHKQMVELGICYLS